MTIPFSQLLVLFISLLSIFSPPAMIGPIASITGKYSRDKQRHIAWQVTWGYIVVLLISAWVGQWLLSILGITVGGLIVAGGLALFFVGMPLMMRGHKTELKPETLKKVEKEEEGTDKDKPSVVVPLIFPMAVGGATAAIVIAQASQWNSIVDLLLISAVCGVMGLVIFLTYFFAGPIARKLRPHSLDILGRISGIILVAIAAQLLVNGILELISNPGIIDLFN